MSHTRLSTRTCTSRISSADLDLKPAGRHPLELGVIRLLRHIQGKRGSTVTVTVWMPLNLPNDQDHVAVKRIPFVGHVF